MINSYSIFTDGGSRGNPGRAAIGFVIINRREEIVYKYGKVIGVTTNNVAEYTAVIEALTWIKSNLDKKGVAISLNFYSDSELIVNQINGRYKVRDMKLARLFDQTKILLNQLSAKYFFRSIRREKNTLADSLVNQSLDME